MRKRIGLALILVLALVLALCAQGFAEGGYESLKRGDKGEQVKALQERLKELGWYPMTCTAISGPVRKRRSPPLTSVTG